MFVASAIDYLMTTNDYITNDDGSITATYLGLDVCMCDIKGETGVSVLFLKQQFDNAARTESDNSGQLIDKLQRLYAKHPEMFCGSIDWIKIEHFHMVVTLCLTKFVVCTESWMFGYEDWDTDFDEFVYVRPEGDHIKFGRAMNMYGRDAGYGSHLVYCLAWVRHGSPAERAMKKIFWGRFIKTKGERIKVPKDYTKNELMTKYSSGLKYEAYTTLDELDRIKNAFFDCFDEYSEYINQDKSVAVPGSRIWYYKSELSPEENAVKREEFKQRMAPWAKAPIRSIL